MTSFSASAAPPPSRDSNPFATCWTRPGALAWHGDVEGIVERLRHAGWRGQIVGPHGTGKSTLLHALVEPLRQAGKSVATVEVDSDDAPEADILLVEGFERLRRHAQRRRLAAWRCRDVGFVVTTHRVLRGWGMRLPVIERTTPTLGVCERLYSKLTERLTTPVTLEDVRVSFASHGGDLRETWFDLHSLHERRIRRDRTEAGYTAYPIRHGHCR